MPYQQIYTLLMVPTEIPSQKSPGAAPAILHILTSFPNYYLPTAIYFHIKNEKKDKRGNAINTVQGCSKFPRITVRPSRYTKRSLLCDLCSWMAVSATVIGSGDKCYGIYHLMESVSNDFSETSAKHILHDQKEFVL